MSGDSETRPLTYDQLAEALGIRLDSARQRVARRRWRKVRGNDGRVLIQVPVEALPRERPPSGGTMPARRRAEPPHEAGTEPPCDAGTDPPQAKGEAGSEPPQLADPDRDRLHQTIGRLQAERATAEALLAECRLALAETRERAEQEAVRATRLAVEAAAAEILRETVEALKTALQAERELRATEAALRSAPPPARLPWWRRLSLAGERAR